MHLGLNDLDGMSLALFNEVADLMVDDNPSKGVSKVRIATQLDMDLF